MDLFFEPTKGMPFCIEVGYFDTIKEIKEKVTKYHGIPVIEQTLIFQDKTLPDDLNIHTSNILDRSRIKLLITTTQPPSPHQINTSTTTTTTGETTQKIKLILKPFGATVEMDMKDSVLKLKEKMNETEGIPLSRTIVYAKGIELQDHKTLMECQLVDGSEIEMTLKPPPATSNVMQGKKVKVHVMSKCGEKITLEMNPLNNVGELRKELQKVRNGFRLPEEGYFFIYKQNVMEEEQSFRWHRVAHGDTIEIFNGCVTGGS